MGSRYPCQIGWIDVEPAGVIQPIICIPELPLDATTFLVHLRGDLTQRA
ncbi:hypothetical protein [Thiolapillus sp.]|nr:hypothetical protein [Thiolapillus sp.]